MGVADVFRAEWPRLVATLMRDVGDLTIAEDAAQDAFIEASTRWPADGVPERPGAWLITTGRRKAIDQIRRRPAIRGSSAGVGRRCRNGQLRQLGVGSLRPRW